MTDTSKAPIARVVALGICNDTPIGPDGQRHLCGQVHTRCSGHVKASNPERIERRGLPCPQPAMIGQTVCYQHGGRSPQAKAAAARKIAEEQAERSLARLVPDRPRTVGTAVQELTALAGRILDQLDGAEQLVRQLEAAGTIVDGDDVAPVVKLHERALDRASRLWVDLAKLGLTERMVRLDEQQAETAVAAVLAGLADAGVDTPAVRAAVAARLRAIEAVGVEEETG